ncbi:P-loop NTPase [candidate division KSB1 bacterium]
MGITKEQVIEILKKVTYPGLSRDIISFGFVKDVIVKGSKVTVCIEITTKDSAVKDKLDSDIREVLSMDSEISDVITNISINSPKQQPVNEQQTVVQQDLVPQAKHKIAVASGKGGVGKSTVSVNLAVTLVSKGYKVGLLDADIYGPSIPTMLTPKEDKIYTKDNKIVPLERNGLQYISIGFFLTKDTPLIWRGPMVIKAIQQLLEDVAWGKLDYLIIDLPPGTGDAQLSISQLLKLQGAVIVSTPQDLALIDAIKGVQMFLKIQIPVLGIIENMSYFLCPHCTERSEIFGHGGARKECERLNVPFLGEIPLNPELRISGDSGRPYIMDNPKSEISSIFSDISKKIISSTK